MSGKSPLRGDILTESISLARVDRLVFGDLVKEDAHEDVSVCMYLH